VTVTIDVWSDFVCPWCFLVASSLDKLRERLDVEITWHSYILRQPGTEISPEHKARIDAGHVRFLEAARAQYGIEINRGPFGLNSIPALVGEKYAESQGKGDEYHHVVQDAYWLDAQRIDDLNVLKGLAVKAGLDGDQFIDALSDPQYQEEVSNDVQFAQVNGITGVPALIFNEKYVISGAQPFEVLLDIVQQLEAGVVEETETEEVEE
jgi:predicted DsbA family dithiol-disulfide isomerase